MPTDEKRSPREHSWSYFALGRRCEVCGLVQATDEIDDSVPCPGRERGGSRRPARARP